MEALYSPPLIGNERSYTLTWTEMKTTMPKDVYMGSIALCFLALFASIAQFCTIFFGFILPSTSRLIGVMFCGRFKWVVVLLSYAVLALTILSWTIFFAFNAALSNADVCPGSTSYTPSPFPVTNATQFVEPLWCDSFANSRLLVGVTDWVWGPSVGWVFALLCTPIAFYTLNIMLTVETSPSYYESIGEGSKMTRTGRDYGSRDDGHDRDRGDRGGRGGRGGDRDRDRDRDRDWDRRDRDRDDRGREGRGRDDPKRDSRKYDDEKMQKKYDSFRV